MRMANKLQVRSYILGGSLYAFVEKLMILSDSPRSAPGFTVAAALAHCGSSGRKPHGDGVGPLRCGMEAGGQSLSRIRSLVDCADVLGYPLLLATTTLIVGTSDTDLGRDGACSWPASHHYIRIRYGSWKRLALLGHWLRAHIHCN